MNKWLKWSKHLYPWVNIKKSVKTQKCVSYHRQISRKREETPTLGKNTDKKANKSRIRYEILEELVRMKVKEFKQDILEKRSLNN